MQELDPPDKKAAAEDAPGEDMLWKVNDVVHAPELGVVSTSIPLLL